MVTFKVENLKEMNSALQTFVDYLKAQSVPDETTFDSKLVSCELITNVIRHCGQSATFSGEIVKGNICITVSSEGRQGEPCKQTMPKSVQEPVLPDVFAESGRGLYIVKSLCQTVHFNSHTVQVTINIPPQK
jgi:anti-sigma regulatory factor (Ser/Thr protein kinase)